jgi:hypothetical protein
MIGHSVRGRAHRVGKWALHVLVKYSQAWTLDIQQAGSSKPPYFQSVNYSRQDQLFGVGCGIG